MVASLNSRLESNKEEESSLGLGVAARRDVDGDRVEEPERQGPIV